MIKENEIKKWFYDNEFMDCGLFDMTSVSDFLFRVSRDPDDVSLINEMYDAFMVCFVEAALEEDTLPIDLILDMVEIDDFVDYVKKKFMILVKADNDLLNMNARELFINMFSSPSTLFNAFRWGNKKLGLNRV